MQKDQLKVLTGDKCKITESGMTNGEKDLSLLLAPFHQLVNSSFNLTIARNICDMNNRNKINHHESMQAFGNQWVLNFSSSDETYRLD